MWAKIDEEIPKLELLDNAQQFAPDLIAIRDRQVPSAGNGPLASPTPSGNCVICDQVGRLDPGNQARDFGVRDLVEHGFGTKAFDELYPE